MSKPLDHEQQLLPSLLERLKDDDPQNQQERAEGYNQRIAELESCVKRDLENLLNTRRRCESWPAELRELDDSLLNYGLPDFLAMNLAFDEGRQVFRRMIEHAVKTNEPRLFDVKVIILDNSEPLQRSMRFRIEAKLRAEPAPEVVSFDSVLEPVTCKFTLQQTSHE